MTLLQSILLGALQGLTEFLPVSSSGHLKICEKLFKLEEVPVLFDVILHLATLLAVFIFFRKEIGKFFAVLFRWILRKPEPENQTAGNQSTGAQTESLCITDKAGQRTIIAILITTFITGVIGIVTSKLIPELPVKFVFIGFFVTSAFLIISGILSKKQNTIDYTGITIKQSIAVGIMQGLGTLPGVSRSGSTIAGSLFTGVKRNLAGEYSFIVSIPAILGAFILELKDLDTMTSSISPLTLLAGCLAAFITGYFALAVLMKIIKKGKLEWFAAYLIPAGILGLIFIA
ncbi:undecaprenyl-diphosphate phosphatase [Treponema sp.]|uniref:undecaprenyl-diphosphate phosphatase n=1 Tax=Treponema sp. TaxID=166 RepID=UPI00298EA8CC|nr:undecaprenyl-diphosphate phosphatase [Treponema sp.]MCR5614315.1 undecaprenyl-diphosphate phosphatase [Treponema sp.]